MPKLYYVDDQTDYKATLSHIMSIATTSLPDLKMYTDVESFMKDVQKTSPDSSDSFLLDINMPVPRRLKTQPGVRPPSRRRGSVLRHRISEVAAQQGLCFESGPGRVHHALGNAAGRTRSGYSFQNDVGNIRYHNKSESIPLRDWIKQRFP